MTQIIIMTTIHGGYSKFCCWCFFFNEFLSNFSWPIILVASFYIFYSVLSEVFFLKSMIIGKCTYVAVRASCFFLVKIHLVSAMETKWLHGHRI